MKKIAFMLLAATLCFSACKKQQTAAPAGSAQITEADFNGSRATISGLQYKKSDEGLELDYDLVIKQVSANKYEAAMKVNGVKLNGKKLSGYKSSAIFGAVLGLNTSKEDKAVPLDVLLTSDENSTGKDDKIITFPAFEHKGELAYDLVDVTVSIKLKGGNLTLQDNSRFTFFGEGMSVTDGSLKIGGGNVIFNNNSTVLLNDSKTTVGTNFSLLMLTDGTAIMEDKTTVFVLSSGHTITQAPEVAKIKIVEEKDGDYGYVTLVISGDPARYITSVSYQFCPADGGAKDSKDQPTMKFEATHYNEQNGVQRFRSTQTWTAVYGKTKPPKHLGCTQYWHGSTRVDILSNGEVTYVKK